jgi:uncharacterized protein (DUF885 family)
VDQQMLRSQVGFLLHQQELRYYERAVDSYIAEPFRGVDWQIQQMTDVGGGRLGTEAEWALVVARVRAIPQFLSVAETNLKAGAASGNLPDRRMVARDGIAAARDAADYFRKSLPQQARGYIGARPFAARLLTGLTPACEAAAGVFSSFAEELARIYPAVDTVDRFAVGEAEYAFRLRNNLHETRSAGELFAYGKAQTALYQAGIYKVAQEVSAADE